MKADWLRAIKTFITFANLDANTLGINLYKHPSKEIGLKSFNPNGEFTFGIKVTK
jgi:hypothetical protein